MASGANPTRAEGGWAGRRTAYVCWALLVGAVLLILLWFPFGVVALALVAVVAHVSGIRAARNVALVLFVAALAVAALGADVSERGA